MIIESTTISLTRRLKPFLRAALLLSFTTILLVTVTPNARAVPYASKISVSAGTVSFVLNEGADNVTVRFDGGATSQDLGALARGSHSFSLGAATTFEIVVSKAGVAPWTIISADSNPLLLFNSGRGVAVNQNPSSPHFGRIYVANSASGTVATNSVAGIPQTRAVGEGIYILNADQSDALGRGDTASTAGIAFDSAAAGQGPNSPWRVEVGEDSTLYIADFSTATACVYFTDPDVTAGGPVLNGIGSAANTAVHSTICGSPTTKGSLAGGNLVLWAIDGARPGNFNKLHRWDINSGPLPSSAAPVTFPVAAGWITSVANVTTDNDRAPDGKLFIMENRSNGSEAGLEVLDSAGAAVIWDSRTESRSISNNASATDILRAVRAVKVSADGRRVALIRDDMQTWVLPLTNGIPDLGARELVNTAGITSTLGRDVSFDIAGNLYALSSGNALLRIFSPGGTSRTITRSDGTFTLVRPPAVSVVATDSLGSEEGPNTGTFSIYRPGDSIGSALDVSFTLSGTATNGVDYTILPLTVTIPAGETNVIVTVTPIDDSDTENTENVILTLVSTADYDLQSPVTAQVNITDNEYPVLTVKTNRSPIYEGQSLPMTFDIARQGNTNGDVFVEYTLSGTATAGADFQNLPASFLYPAGQTNLTISITPIDDTDFEGDETIQFALATGFGDYIIGTPGSATGTIRDNEFPAACVLFADDFETDSSANWITRFGANNGTLDGGASFSVDYSQLGIPSAPHSIGGTTRGVQLAVNKDATASSAAVNIYPAGTNFSGNYALRADMLLSMGTSATTEHAQLGINHSGNFTNRASQNVLDHPSTAGGDGVWVGIETDGANLRDYSAYTYPTATSLPLIVASNTASAMAGVLTVPPYAFPGAPGNVPTTSPKTWADVELRQLNGVITLLVNQYVVLTYTNTSGFTNGTFMLGMNDQYDSVSPAANFVIFDNVRVVSLDFVIKNTQFVGANQIQIDFVSPLGGQVTSFHLQSGSDPASLVDDPSAVITAIPGGFRAVTTRTAPFTFYRIRQ